MYFYLGYCSWIFRCIWKYNLMETVEVRNTGSFSGTMLIRLKVKEHRHKWTVCEVGIVHLIQSFYIIYTWLEGTSVYIVICWNINIKVRITRDGCHENWKWLILLHILYYLVIVDQTHWLDSMGHYYKTDMVASCTSLRPNPANLYVTVQVHHTGFSITV